MLDDAQRDREKQRDEAAKMQYESRPVDDSIKTGEPVLVACSMRWLPYKKASEQYRRGIRGRWQVANDYGWENVAGDGPSEYLSPINK
jgi:hypothetical protein